MSQTRANKIVTILNGDAYDLAGDLADLADSANVVIPVANATERDALAKPVGRTVTRNDVAGQALETTDGTSWFRHVSSIVQANTNHVGSGMNTNVFTTGVLRPYIQAGTSVVTTDASGYFVLGYPVTFPNGVIAAVLVNGDASTGRGRTYAVAGTPFTQTTGLLYGSVADSAGAGIASVTVRVNWIAFGW